MTTYLTWIPSDTVKDEDVDKIPLERFRVVQAHRPQDAAEKAALNTMRSQYQWDVDIRVMRAEDSRNTWSRKIRKYCISFSRAIGAIEVVR